MSLWRVCRGLVTGWVGWSGPVTFEVDTMWTERDRRGSDGRGRGGGGPVGVSHPKCPESEVYIPTEIRDASHGDGRDGGGQNGGWHAAIHARLHIAMDGLDGNSFTARDDSC